jgi:hypothetical protein
MSINLDVVCVDRQITALHSQEGTVQVIGEILPFILAKYGIEQVAFPEAWQVLERQFDYST